MVTILHLITGLETGSAERMLTRLVSQTDRQRFTSVVVSMIRTSLRAVTTLPCNCERDKVSY